MRQNDFLDLCKFIMSLMVVAIHTGLCIPVGKYNVLWPWLRVAVPLFFLMSSYFFFVRYNDADNKKDVLKKWIGRNGRLYLFWFIALLPVTIYVRYKSWFGHGALVDIMNFTKSFVFGSTFVASWFITALVIAVLVIVAVQSILGKVGVVLVGIAGFIISVLTSSYQFESVYIAAYNSFPVALIWAGIGLFFALQGERPYRLAFPMVVISAIMFWMEWKWRAIVTGEYKFDCYFMLLPLVTSVFAVIKNIQMKIKFARIFRMLSVVIFCLHGSVIMFARVFIEKMCGISDEYSVCTFLLTSFSCIIACRIITCVERSEGFKFLRHSH